MRLSEYFEGIASKRLSAVEASPDRSHQHEFNGVQPLRSLLGDSRRTFSATFVYLAEVSERWATASGDVTWYDARAAHLTRTEYRLYFSSNSVTDLAREGDLMVLGALPGGRLLLLIAEASSTAENQVRYLFHLENVAQTFITQSGKDLRTHEIDFAAEWILEQIGLSSRGFGDEALLSRVVSRFHGEFPQTSAFSAFARETAGPVDVRSDPDQALIEWMSHELLLFRLLERHVVADRISRGFGQTTPDVDAFLGFSLSVQNRRKSRAGRALENHLQHIFEVLQLRFTRHAQTERTSRPDFLFPSERAYHDLNFPSGRLTMLAAKSTCKERWRQILPEADRIQAKHLLTLEPGISTAQTAEMSAHSVRLVVPTPLHGSYSLDQRREMMSLSSFIDWVKRLGCERTAESRGD